jgi:type VI secretion system secreted protein VgrG
VHLKAGMNVVIEAGVSVSLKVGGNFITIDQGGVYIEGAMVFVNSGGSAGAGSGASPLAPKPPKRPRGAKGGSDMVPARPSPPAAYSPQAMALKLAWQAATPVCEQCQAAQ